MRYSRKLSLDASIQASIQATRSATVNVLQNATFSSTYITALAGYDRKVGKRLFAGVSVGARKLYQAGPDPKMDFNASLSLRYKLGDLL